MRPSRGGVRTCRHGNLEAVPLLPHQVLSRYLHVVKRHGAGWLTPPPQLLLRLAKGYSRHALGRQLVLLYYMHVRLTTLAHMHGH
jgi:hypothetical protein